MSLSKRLVSQPPRRILTVDIETRSEANLLSCGAARYGADPTSEIMCISYCLGVDAPRVIPLVFPSDPAENIMLALKEDGSPFLLPSDIGTLDELVTLLECPDTVFSAHNENFELGMFVYRLWTAEKWAAKPKRDTMPLLQVRGYPGALEKGMIALSAPFKKNMAGNKIMKQVCKPRPAYLKNGSGSKYFDTADKLAATYAYCMDDVKAQAWLGAMLPDLTPFEQAVYDCTQRRNNFGIRFDTEFISQAIGVYKKHAELLWGQLSEKTGGALTNTNQTAKVLNYLQDTFFLPIVNLQAETVKEIIEAGGLPDLAKFILEVRQQTAASSVKKLEKILAMAIGSRVYGTTMYCGAIATRRITSKGINAANFPRGDSDIDVDQAMSDIKGKGYDGALLHARDPVHVVKACLRGSIIPSDGCEFIGADYSSVEAVIGMWVAGAPIYQEMATNPGVLYLKTGSSFFGRQITEDDEVERKRGKIGSLGFQYGAGVPGFRKLSKTLGWDVSAMSDKEVEGLRDTYRKTYPELCSRPTRNNPYARKGLWHMLDTQCKAAVKQPDVPKKINDRLWCVFVSKTDSLDLWLPSGRPIHMPSPAMGKNKWGGDSLSFLGYKQGKIVRVDTYGGSLHESVCQSLSRDITVAAELRVEAAGYRPVQQVYDEIWAEVPIGAGSIRQFEQIMCQDPGWFGDLVVHAKGWRTNRMRKM